MRLSSPKPGPDARERDHLSEHLLGEGHRHALDVVTRMGLLDAPTRTPGILLQDLQKGA